MIIARAQGFDYVIIELDAKVMVDLISSCDACNPLLMPIISDCRRLIETFPTCTFLHIYREANTTADKGAQFAHDDGGELQLFESPPSFVIPLLLYDNVGGSQTRLVGSVVTPNLGHELTVLET